MRIYKYNHQLHKWEDDSQIRRDCWVTPDGDVFNCTAHEVYAEYIVKEFFNECDDSECCGDYLINLGWTKFTTSCMNTFYKQDGLYNNLTEQQKYIYENCFDF